MARDIVKNLILSVIIKFILLILNPNMNIAYTYKSMETNSSKRSIIWKKGMEENYLNTINDINIKKHHRKPNKKKLSRLQELEVITIHDTLDKNQYYNAKSNSIIKNYYYTFHDESDINKNELDSLFLNEKNNMINLYKSGFRIVDTTDGAIMMIKNSPIFILVKRKDALEHNNNGRADFETLEWLMKYNNNINSRGSEKSGFSEKYVTIGAHGSHFEKGIHIKKLKGKEAEFHEPHLKKWFGRVKKIAKEYLPSGLLSSLMISKFIVDDTINYDYNDGKKNNDKFNKSIWASMASSYNYISPAHTDNDSFLSCLTTTLYPINEPRNGKYIYPDKTKICCYFCLPGVNTAVALRPGDVLFFNPLEKHCLSQRTVEYLMEKLYVSSFYITTKQISGNDNTKSFNLEEKLNELIS
jgi:hypothetical protein